MFEPGFCQKRVDLFVFATEGGGVEKWVFGHYFLAIP